MLLRTAVGISAARAGFRRFAGCFSPYVSELLALSFAAHGAGFWVKAIGVLPGMCDRFAIALAAYGAGLRLFTVGIEPFVRNVSFFAAFVAGRVAVIVVRVGAFSAAGGVRFKTLVIV